MKAGEDHPRADLVEIGNMLADLRTGKAAHRQQRNIHQNVGRHLADGDEAGRQHDQDRKYRQRHDTDVQVHDAPPGAKGGRRIPLIAHHCVSPFISERMSRTRGASKLAAG